MAEWKFRPKAEGEIKEDPIQERFFTTSDVGDLTNALIRETIQNSLDARIDKENDPAEVRFYICSRGINPESYNPFFTGLIQHLKSEYSGLEELPDFSKPMTYLAIDDYYTTGLEGDILEEDDPPVNDPEKHNFYWFWRNIARSGKGNDDLGRWGVGKTVYSASSDINSFFGLTVRHGDGKKLLLGKSVLKWHTLPGDSNWNCPYGFFSNYNDHESYFAIPFDSEHQSDRLLIEDFEHTFKTKRADENGNEYYGLSIVIPFLKEEIELNGIKKAIIKQYFYPIIEGKLIVTVETDSGENLTINNDTIEEFIENIEFDDYGEKKNLKNIFKLAKKSLEIEDSEYIKFKVPPLDKAPRWQDTWLFDDAVYKKIDEARFNFENGEVIPFKIPLRIQETGKNAEIGWYRAFVQYDGFLNETDSYFIRDGITISGIKTIKKKGLRILIVISEKKIARMFGDSENPAHTEFQKTAPHFRNKYLDGSHCITFLTNTVGNLYNLLIRPSEGTDDEILKDIFFMELELDAEPKHKEPEKKEKGDEDIGKEKFKGIESKVSQYLLRRVEGGIMLTNNPKSDSFPKQLKLQMAFMVPKGNPLKKYSIWDFNLGDGTYKIETSGVTIASIYENKVEIDIIEESFNFQISGFDTERDLFIKVS